MTTQTTEAATPETDDQPMINAINDNGYQVPCVDIEYARKLERERDEAREDLEFRRELYAILTERLRRIKRERDETREKLHRVLKLLDDYDEAIKNPFWDAFKKRFTWEAGK